MIMVAIKVYDDAALDATEPNEMQVSCRLGTEALQYWISRSTMLTVDCAVPRISKTVDQAPMLDNVDVRVFSISPEMAFIDERNIEVLVRAEPLYNVEQITCQLHDVRLPGEYMKIGDVEYVKCVIPDEQYLRVESVAGMPPSMEFVIEVSVNGVRFSDDGITFKLIQNNQEVRTDFSVGPDTGGTVIQVDVVDFPANNDRAKESRCIFAGYEDYPVLEG